MVKFKYGRDKQEILKNLDEKRSDVDLDEVVFMLCSGEAIDVVNSRNYPNQIIFVLPYKHDLLAVPCVVEDENTFFIKTLWYSRKYRKRYANVYDKIKKEDE